MGGKLPTRRRRPPRPRLCNKRNLTPDRSSFDFFEIVLKPYGMYLEDGVYGLLTDQREACTLRTTAYSLVSQLSHGVKLFLFAFLIKCIGKVGLLALADLRGLRFHHPTACSLV